MAILDLVKNMKGRGMSESEIIKNLQDQGVSPKAIAEALDQSKVKEAVERDIQTPSQNMAEFGEENFPQRKIAPEDESYYYPPEQYTPGPSYTVPEREGYGEAQYPIEEGFESSEQLAGLSESGTGTMIEIAEQVFEEKIKKMSGNIEKLREFSVIAESRLFNLEERIRKLESVIDVMQIKILEKVGSYGQGIESIKKEMGMMQDSFSKMLPEMAKPKIKSSEISEKSVQKKTFSKNQKQKSR